MNTQKSPEAERPRECDCATWGTDLPVSGHHYNCEQFRPKPSIEAIIKLLDGMEFWAADEDGIHPDAWEAYKAGCALTCRPIKGDDDVPAAAAEPRAERPSLLLAKYESQWQWWSKLTCAKRSELWCIVAAELEDDPMVPSRSFTEVDRERSDAEALKIYDVDSARSPAGQ